MNKRPKPPSHLRPPTAKWWKEVVECYDLEGHHLRLLALAAEAFDRTQEAREAIQQDGLTIRTGDGSLKAHPCVAVERDSRLAFARLVRELDLDTEPPVSDRRPPALRSNRRGT